MLFTLRTRPLLIAINLSDAELLNSLPKLVQKADVISIVQ